MAVAFELRILRWDLPFLKIWIVATSKSFRLGCRFWSKNDLLFWDFPSQNFHRKMSRWQILKALYWRRSSPGPSRQTGEPGKEGRETNPFHIPSVWAKWAVETKHMKAFSFLWKGMPFLPQLILWDVPCHLHCQEFKIWRGEREFHLSSTHLAFACHSPQTSGNRKRPQDRATAHQCGDWESYRSWKKYDKEKIPMLASPGIICGDQFPKRNMVDK